MAKESPSLDAWMREAKADPTAAQCGMYLAHNGVVRVTPKAEVRGVETDGVQPGERVTTLTFGYDQDKVDAAIAAARALQNGGYASDPDYAAKLIRLIRQYHLDRYD